MLPAHLSIPARFEIVRQIGEGGMGVVYEALDVERNLLVALKTLRYRDPDALARFKHEFRALQDIHHPNLVALGELVGDASDTFFTMELVAGVDLYEWVCGARAGKVRLGGATAIDALPSEPHDTDRELLVNETPVLASHQRVSAFPRGGGRFDESRLRDAFRQIALGLSALHEAGKIHRDVKPSNVRVTPDGRVVLLDFGLVFDVDAKQGATEMNVVGTPAYMAPEQSLEDPVGPEADWYAVGAMLYLCLTGRLPFEGAAVAVLMAKHYQEPPPPSTLATEIPRDLEQLCMDMLQFEPGTRPTGREIWRRLSVRSSRPPAPSNHPRAALAVDAPFVGRADEMSVLHRALEDVTREKRTISVIVHGESGVGKSSLARRFLEEMKARGLLVLTGRCYEREAVPYKAFDEVIDTLSRRLARMPKEETLALLPSRIGALAQLFPALGRVPAVAEASGVPDRDPHERRRGAFRALRQLLRNLAAQHTVVIAIDDLQWTDADSLSLLADLLRPPDAPALLLVATMRSGEDATHPSAAPKLVAEIPGDVRTVHVGRLAKADAQELASQLLQREAGVSHADAVAIAREAGGHPLFIDELVRHASARRGDQQAGEPLRLDDALWTRVGRLDLSARRVLEVACLLGAPVAQEVVAMAAALEMDDFVRAVSLLRATNLVRTGGARVTDAIEPFHDRVREAVAARLDPDAKRECHVRLASALELAKGSDPEVLATHWAGAGEPAKAARYAIGAAEQAAQTLAFERAARLFQRAIDLLPATDPRMRGLREQLGDALANAGQPTRAAVEYGRAAEGASAADALDLRRRAAEQLLRAGEVRRGMDAAREVLTAVGLGLPRTRFGVIISFLWVRFLLRLRGLGFVPLDAKDVPAEDLLRIDVCWSVSCSLTYADPFFAALFLARHLLLALRSPEKLRVIRALAIEGAFAAATGASAWPRAERALLLARATARTCADPYADAIVTTCEGIGYVFNLRFTRAMEPLESAAIAFRDHCPGSKWEIATVRYYGFLAQFFTCQFGTLRVAQEIALKEALESGDRYASVMLRVGTVNRCWLLAGDSARARSELEAATREWPSTSFHVVHYYALISMAYIDMYEGHPERAMVRFDANRRALRSSMLLEMEGPRLEYAGIHGRVALSLALAQVRAGKAPRLREAEKAIRVFERRPCPVSLASALSLRAGVAAVRGNREVALAHLEELAREESGEVWLAAQTARWVAAKMRGPGSEGEATKAQAELASRGVLIGKPLAAVQLPGLERYL